MRLLLLDDDPDARAAAVRALEQGLPGVEVVAPADPDGLEALLAGDAPDGVVTEHRFAGTDALDLARRIRRRWPGCPVALLTTADAEEVAPHARGAGIAHVFAKHPGAHGEAARLLVRGSAATPDRESLGARLEPLLDRFRTGVFRAGPDGTLRECNPAFLDLLGASGLAAARELDLRCLLPRPDEVGDGEVREVRFRRGALDVWLSVTAAVGRGPGGEPVVDGLVEDVSERKSIEIERNRLLERERAARAEAEAASALKDEFLATLSHELRTPISAIVGWVELLRSGRLDDERFARAVDSIARNARRQGRLIQDILDFSAMVSGRVRLEPTVIDFAALLDQALDSSLPAAEAKSVELHKDAPPVPVHVWGDPDRLLQVVANLLANAIAHTPAGGRVRLGVEVEGERAVLTVADTGEGIDPAFLPHVFEAFRQAEGGASRRKGGLGLGLAVVHRLVSMHGGAIRAESDGRGRGSTFRVELPVSHEAPTDGSGREPPAGRSAELPDLAGLRILVVDDEPDVREWVTAALEECSGQVRSAGSVEEALATYREWSPHVLLCDLAMPERDGYDLLRELVRLREAGGSRPAVAALTAFAHPEERRKTQLAGFDGHLTKPLEPREICRAVAQLAGRTAASAEG